MSASVIRIKPFYYIHVLNNNTNVTRVEVGPQTFTRKEHETLVLGPEPMIMIPPRHYCVISNPVAKEKEDIVVDSAGQVKIRHGDEEVRLESEPFPLYPGEQLSGSVSSLTVVRPNTALRLLARRDFEDKKAGDEWLFRGPGTYIPRVEVRIQRLVEAKVLVANQALRLRAVKEFTNSETGVTRRVGEEYLYKEAGSYLPEVEEEVVETVNAHILTEKKALHLRALQTFTDAYDHERKAGEEWLVSIDMTEAHIPDVFEKVVGEVSITVLSSREYCVILDPFDPKTGKNQMGSRKLVQGEASFFLQPGERLESGIEKIHVLDSETALLLRARELFEDSTPNGAVTRHPGDRWMIHGPRDYVPPVQVEILEKRKTIPLDTNEGIYVRDIQSGKVTAIMGESYMLKSYEELWQKELSLVVEELLAKEHKGTKYVRDKTRVVTYRAPHNTAVQIYDYKAKKARVILGPELVTLGPDDQFTVLDLSGDKPKKPHVIKGLSLQLGPDFMTDIVIVETADHARLSLKLSYNWAFELPAENELHKLFSVPDFVGDACKAIASRVRGAVASHNFDEFHKHSAKLIRKAVFGVDENNKVRNRFFFSANCLSISNIDIQSVEPVDSRTRDALQKSVQLAIEITTKSQEATARHDAERREQEAKGRLERQKIDDEAKAEERRKELLHLQALSAVVESTGQATAEAKARAEAATIEGEAAVEQAKNLSEAENIKAEAELSQIKNEQEAEINHKKALNDLEIKRARELADIEGSKFKRIVDAIGKDTLKAIACAGPDVQAKLLGGLGLQSLSLTSGNSPLNLFNKPAGLIEDGDA